MAKSTKKVAKKTAEKKPAESLVKTISEVKALSEKEQQAFRDSGGTTIEG